MGLPVVLYCTLTANAFHLSPRSAAGLPCHPLIPRKRCRERKTCIDSNSTRRSLADAAARLSLLPDCLLCVTCITFQPALGSSAALARLARPPASFPSSIEPLRHIKTCRKADLFSSPRFSVRKILIIESTRKNDGPG